MSASLEGLFGEKGTITLAFSNFGTSISTTWDGIFGEQGSLTTGFGTFVTQTNTSLDTFLKDVNSKFNQLGLDLIKWATDTFGEKGTIIEGIKKFNGIFEDWWGKLFGPEGSLAAWFKSMFDSGGVFATFLSDVYDLGEKLLIQLVAGINAKTAYAIGFIAGIISDIVSKLRELFGVSGGGSSGSGQKPEKVTGGGKGGLGSVSNLLKDLIPGGAQGLNMVVPGGFPNDTFPVLASSGEHILITPEGESLFGPDFFPSLLKGISSVVRSVVSTQLSSIPQTTIINNTKTIQLTVNPTYEQYSSPAGIYYDVTAALASSRI
jgi:hypothetical protein